jgi:hypothetical protein
MSRRHIAIVVEDWYLEIGVLDLLSRQFFRREHPL